jgi:hypothetical protein
MNQRWIVGRSIPLPVLRHSAAYEVLISKRNASAHNIDAARLENRLLTDHLEANRDYSAANSLSVLPDMVGKYL